MSATKTCTRCNGSKPLGDFYANANGTQGRMPYCKECDNTRPRRATAVKVNRMRARHRAVADLIGMYPDEFRALLDIRLAEATEEAESLAETPEAKKHSGSNGGPVRLRPGRRMPGQKVQDRIDVARCPHCVKHHDAGHVCAECGARPTETKKQTKKVSRNQNLVSRPSPKPAPSGMRPRTRGFDAAALAEFNAGTARAAQAAR